LAKAFHFNNQNTTRKIFMGFCFTNRNTASKNRSVRTRVPSRSTNMCSILSFNCKHPLYGRDPNRSQKNQHRTEASFMLSKVHNPAQHTLWRFFIALRRSICPSKQSDKTYQRKKVKPTTWTFTSTLCDPHEFVKQSQKC
jgi:hypothetical protein